MLITEKFPASDATQESLRFNNKIQINRVSSVRVRLYISMGDRDFIKPSQEVRRVELAAQEW